MGKRGCGYLIRRELGHARTLGEFVDMCSHKNVANVSFSGKHISTGNEAYTSNLYVNAQRIMGLSDGGDSVRLAISYNSPRALILADRRIEEDAKAIKDFLNRQKFFAP